MALQLGDVITAIRDRHPAFHRTRITNAVLARFLSDYQNELIGLGVARERMYLAQSVTIALDFNDANDPGVVGANTAGGLPGEVDDDDSVAAVQESAGTLLEPLLTVAEGGQIVVAERVVSGVVGQVVSSTGAGRTVDGDVDRLIHITAGAGRGQVRVVASNTADSWTPSASWETVPDTTSLFTIVEPLVAADRDAGVVTELPARATRTGYLVRLNAQGVPYLDYTTPLVARLDRGVPLPSMLDVLAGTVHFRDQSTQDVTITVHARRHAPPGDYAVYVDSGVLYLCGSEADWADVVSLEIKYVPVGPVFTALTDYFLVPDAARPALVAQGAAFAGGRVASDSPPVTIDVAELHGRADRAEDRYLNTILRARGARVGTIREVW